MQFLDEVKLYVRSGDGGNGCVGFRREKNIPFGGPNGGDGGKGADVIVECVAGLNTLIDYRYQQHFKGKKGEHGKGKNRSGESRDALIIKVPVGTQVFDEDNEHVIVDMLTVGQTHLLAKGGDGGYGNAHFKTSTNQAPRKFIPGWPGEELWIWLRLKLISDVGLLGLPNAGKSTFLAQVSAAKPKIADYPFTTLKPQLGVVRIDDNEFVMADLPGLIKDAHLGAGLGDKFLKHLERCRVLLHLIDASHDEPIEAYKIIREELKEYSAFLENKIEIIALNKKDIIDPDEYQEKIRQLELLSGKKVMPLSGATSFGVKDILRELYKNINPIEE